ncbi:beta-ketoacyl synthase [Actinoplanes sp. N902-109]|uniref:beta-ketoacyl-[acyl-carrier-protein] synthase family protein n=1 Tax=Actinoplanes sp. (strain N902-109) TaxID=649831 RepID=UPI000329491C|nr:beta-ketoacyl-[acyl-carrier-protein] synthase family protein [Actinoplanes sp. N902-109]AGL16346.1 3-ketoacyl-ACP synthase I [Actinoplanes sp. N902-109]
MFSDLRSDVDVVVTGVGVTTPLGDDVPSTWAALLAGQSGIRRLDQLPAGPPDAAVRPARIGAPLLIDPGDRLGPREVDRLDRVQQAALLAAREAWADAGSPEPDPARLAVAVGTAMGGVQTLLAEHDALRTAGAGALRRLGTPMAMAAGPAAAVSIALAARAGTYAPASACAAGAEALATGVRLIRSGAADMVLAGGAETGLLPVVLESFARAGVLSAGGGDPRSACRPFHAGRDGCVLGEGAAMLLLERADTAAARGARPLARLAGAAVTSDGFHVMKPDPSGAGQRRAMLDAVADAGLSPSDIDYVHCHATGTQVGDREEATAIAATLGEGTVVTSTKAATGHLIGAAGALAAVLTVTSIRESLIPHTINLDRPGPGIALDVVTGKPRPAAVRTALSNAFGFGGSTCRSSSPLEPGTAQARYAPAPAGRQRTVPARLRKASASGVPGRAENTNSVWPSEAFTVRAWNCTVMTPCPTVR